MAADGGTLSTGSRPSRPRDNTSTGSVNARCERVMECAAEQMISLSRLGKRTAAALLCESGTIVRCTGRGREQCIAGQPHDCLCWGVPVATRPVRDHGTDEIPLCHKLHAACQEWAVPSWCACHRISYRGRGAAARGGRVRHGTGCFDASPFRSGCCPLKRCPRAWCSRVGLEVHSTLCTTSLYLSHSLVG